MAGREDLNRPPVFLRTPLGGKPLGLGDLCWGHLVSEVGSIHAAMRADERLAAGDMEGEAVWLRIVKSVEELLSEERPEDAEVH